MGNDPSTAPREAKVGGEVHKGTVIRSASQVMPQMLVEHSHDNEQQSKQYCLHLGPARDLVLAMA